MTLNSTVVGGKLLAARRATGLSTRSVAKLIWSKAQISHATLNNYEKGLTTPPIEVLAALADAYARPLTWFLEEGTALTNIQYRALRSKLKVSERHIFEGQCLRWLEAYHRLDKHLGNTLHPQINTREAPSEKGPEALAAWVRKQLKVGEGPIASVVEVLERFGIRVIEVSTNMAISAMAARFGEEFIVALNPAFPGDRCRMNGAHELGHILLGDCTGAGGDRDTVEKPAYEFASRLLLPKTQLIEACGPKSMVKLVSTKETFGISLSAILYRAEKDHIWKSHICKMLWIEFAKRGWKTNEPGQVRPDRATRFESNLDAALIDGKLTWSTAAAITGVREEELRERHRIALGLEDSRFQEKGGAEDDQNSFLLRLA